MKTGPNLITDARKLVEKRLNEETPKHGWLDRLQKWSETPSTVGDNWGKKPSPMQAAQAKQLIVRRIHDLESGKEGHSSDMQNMAAGAMGGGMLFGTKGAVMGGLLGSVKSEWHDARRLRDKIGLSHCPECGGDVHKSASSCPFCHRAHKPGIHGLLVVLSF